MKEKGFTLIELLAVIVILAIIALIATPIVLNIIEDSKKSSKLRSANHYVDAVEQAITRYNMDKGGNFIPNKCDIQLDGDLLCDGTHIVEVEVDGETPVSGKMEFTNGNVTTIDLEFSDKSYFVLDSNGSLVPSKKKDEKQICTLVNDADNSDTVTPGDEYLCKVKDEMEEDFANGYTFYVLSPNEDGTTNLILDRNIYYDENNNVGKVVNADNTGYVKWYDTTDNTNSYGPVTAMTYLHNATKDWNNVPNINVSFMDQPGVSDGYGEIKMQNEETTTITKKDGTKTATYENLKARLPMYSEVTEYGKCTKHIPGITSASCLAWLTPTDNYNYWLLDSSSKFYAWYITKAGILTNNPVTAFNGWGVRPVITLTLN